VLSEDYNRNSSCNAISDTALGLITYLKLSVLIIAFSYIVTLSVCGDEF